MQISVTDHSLEYWIYSWRENCYICNAQQSLLIKQFSEEEQWVATQMIIHTALMLEKYSPSENQSDSISIMAVHTYLQGNKIKTDNL